MLVGLLRFQKVRSSGIREIDPGFPYRLTQMIERFVELPQNYSEFILALYISQINNNYITYTLEIILFSVTEVELFLVKASDLLNEKDKWVKIKLHFFLMQLTILY